jgi:transposase
MARPKKYPEESVQRGVRLALESGRPIAHVAADLGMHPETLRKRVRQAQADGGERPDLPTSAEREEIRRLRREHYELRRANERLLARIRETHAASYYAYGSRRTWKALLRAGERVGRGRVERLMRAHGIQGAKRRGKPWRTTISDPHATRPADLVERDFSAEAPDRLYVADFTYLRCWEGVVFFAS